MYPDFKDEIIMSTIVKDEDNFIKTWIDYHLNLGISRFIIYDNSSNNTLCDVLDDYIQSNIVLLIKWAYPYLLPISGLSGQTTQQNHSIYAFQTSKYIGLFDIDEYINPQGTQTVNEVFEKSIVNKNIDTNTIGGFCILNKFFYNPRNLPYTNSSFLQIFNCDIVSKMDHEKCFVIPKNVITFSVHVITAGKPVHVVDEIDVFFNHYYYLNKTNRGIKNTEITDNSILHHLRLEKN
jgi:hypothetical protein